MFSITLPCIKMNEVMCLACLLPPAITLEQRNVRPGRVTNKELRELDVAKDEFVSIASHQLRTPLTALKGFTVCCSDGDLGPVNDKHANILGK